MGTFWKPPLDQADTTDIESSSDSECDEPIKDDEDGPHRKARWGGSAVATTVLRRPCLEHPPMIGWSRRGRGNGSLLATLRHVMTTVGLTHCWNGNRNTLTELAGLHAGVAVTLWAISSRVVSMDCKDACCKCFASLLFFQSLQIQSGIVVVMLAAYPCKLLFISV